MNVQLETGWTGCVGGLDPEAGGSLEGRTFGGSHMSVALEGHSFGGATLLEGCAFGGPLL